MGLSSICGWYYKGHCQPYQRERQREMSAEFILYWTACSTIFVPLSNLQLWLLRPSAEKKAHLIIARGCSHYKKLFIYFVLQLYSIFLCIYSSIYVSAL